MCGAVEANLARYVYDETGQCRGRCIGHDAGDHHPLCPGPKPAPIITTGVRTVDRPIKDHFILLAAYAADYMPSMMVSERIREVNHMGGENYDSIRDIRCVLNELDTNNGHIEQSTPAIVSIVQDGRHLKLIIRTPDWSDARTVVLNDSQVIDLVEKLLVRYRTIKET